MQGRTFVSTHKSMYYSAPSMNTNVHGKVTHARSLMDQQKAVKLQGFPVMTNLHSFFLRRVVGQCTGEGFLLLILATLSSIGPSTARSDELQMLRKNTTPQHEFPCGYPLTVFVSVPWLSVYCIEILILHIGV